MPVTDHNGENPELLLVGADRPRPLPPEVRARLGQMLLSSAARDVPAPARHRLETSLATGAPPARRHRWWGPWSLGAAAVLVVGLAVGVPLLTHKGASTNLSALSGRGRAGTTSVVKSPAASPPSPRAEAGPKGNDKKPAKHGFAAGKTAGRAPMAAATRALTVVPSSGPATGGNWAVVSGAGLDKSTVVLFGTVKAAKAQVVSAHELRVLVPAHRPGQVEVKVEQPGHDGGPMEVARYRFEPAA